MRVNITNYALTIEQFHELLFSAEDWKIIRIIETNMTLFVDLGRKRYDIGEMFNGIYGRALDLINELEKNGWQHYNSFAYQTKGMLYKNYFLRRI